MYDVLSALLSALLCVYSLADSGERRKPRRTGTSVQDKECALKLMAEHGRIQNDETKKKACSNSRLTSAFASLLGSNIQIALPRSQANHPHSPCQNERDYDVKMIRTEHTQLPDCMN